MQAKKQVDVSTLVAIAKTNDVEIVTKAIHETYGFWVTPEYARDLIAFVNALTEA